MQWYRKRMVIYTILALIAVVIVTLLVNIVIIARNGTVVPVPETPRGVTTVGSGVSVEYVILGDSTAVGQGGDYDRGIATQTAAHIASKGKAVTYQNFAVSGARANDVLTKQLSGALERKPDIVLISIGANDLTHFTSLSSIKKDMQSIVDKLWQANPDCAIVITGTPQMGTVLRFPQPAKYFAGVRTGQMNKVFEQLARQNNLVFARIAEKTGKTFGDNPKLFAADKFHPNNDGYAVWIPFLNQGIDQVL